jgi:3-hydroxyisobutyrate dehydrogenase-like beta-hydroxyacid dehydrogenase
MGLPMTGHLLKARHEVAVASRTGVRSTLPFLWAPTKVVLALSGAE